MRNIINFFRNVCKKKEIEFNDLDKKIFAEIEERWWKETEVKLNDPLIFEEKVKAHFHNDQQWYREHLETIHKLTKKNKLYNRKYLDKEDIKKIEEVIQSHYPQIKKFTVAKMFCDNDTFREDWSDGSHICYTSENNISLVIEQLKSFVLLLLESLKDKITSSNIELHWKILPSYGLFNNDRTSFVNCKLKIKQLDEKIR